VQGIEPMTCTDMYEHHTFVPFYGMNDKLCKINIIGKYLCFVMNFESEMNDKRKKSIIQLVLFMTVCILSPHTTTIRAYSTHLVYWLLYRNTHYHSLNFPDARTTSICLTLYIAIKYHLTLIPLCKFNSDSSTCIGPHKVSSSWLYHT
jgi:hypothetical protein